MPDPKQLVINTGPILAIIAACGDLRILSLLYQAVTVPCEVCQEVEAGGRIGFGIQEFRQASWLNKRDQPVALSPLLSRILDRGEAAVIQSALNERIDVVAIDEPVGRRIARLHGLQLTGSIGILLRAKKEGHLASVKVAMSRMREHGIWLSDRVIDFALKESGER